MLAALALFDSLYILLSLWEAMRREMNSNDFFAYAVRYVTYPLQNIVLCITIFLPVALAFERYRAIRYVKFIYSEKATKFCEISTLFLTERTVVKSKVDISQKFVAFSEYMNFN